MNIISMEILKKVKGKKGNLQSGIMEIMWKSRGKMVISQCSRKFLKTLMLAMWHKYMPTLFWGLKCTKRRHWSSLTMMEKSRKIKNILGKEKNNEKKKRRVSHVPLTCSHGYIYIYEE